jgi:hypothetical protein
MSMYDTRNSDAIVRLAELTQKGELMWGLLENTKDIPKQVLIKLQGAISHSLYAALELYFPHLNDRSTRVLMAIYQGRILYLFKRINPSDKSVQTCLVIQEDTAFTTFPTVSALDDLYLVAQKQIIPRKGVESFVNDVLSPA